MGTKDKDSMNEIGLLAGMGALALGAYLIFTRQGDVSPQAAPDSLPQAQGQPLSTTQPQGYVVITPPATTTTSYDVTVEAPTVPALSSAIPSSPSTGSSRSRSYSAPAPSPKKSITIPKTTDIKNWGVKSPAQIQKEKTAIIKAQAPQGSGSPIIDKILFGGGSSPWL